MEKKMWCITFPRITAGTQSYSQGNKQLAWLSVNGGLHWAILKEMLLTGIRQISQATVHY